MDESPNWAPVRRWMLPIFLVLLYGVIEGAFFLGLWVLDVTRGIRYRPVAATLTELQRERLRTFLEDGGVNFDQDSVLGWVPFPDGEESNSAAMRDDVEYSVTPGPDTLRISTFGDSYTYGSSLRLEETFQKRLTEINPSIEALNYGVGGYGLDQAYLRYLRSGTEYNPHIVLLGYMTQNIGRHVNVFRTFYIGTNGILTKPRFVVQNGDLLLLENPIATVEDHRTLLLNDTTELQRIGENDFHYRRGYARGVFDFLPTVRFAKIFYAIVYNRLSGPISTRDGMFNEESEAYEVTATIFDVFHKKVLENAAMPVILVFPDPIDQARSRAGQRHRYAPLLEHFDSQGYRYIDALEALAPYESRYTSADFTADEYGHLSAIAHELVAELIYEQLEAWQFTDPVHLQDAIRMERDRFGVGH